MKKLLTGIVVIIFAFFVSYNITYAAFNLFFGGEITSMVAPEIGNWENEYDCNLNGGSTIEVNSMNGVTSYYIPGYATPVTNTVPALGQNILGIYGYDTPITCTRDEEKNVTSQITVYLPTIIYFGTSVAPI